MRETYKHKFSIKDYYYALVFSPRALFRLFINRLNHKIDMKFIEKIMLAVTEVNGCEVCSYVHTKVALKTGFTQDEIKSFLNADGQYIEPEEVKAILFAQHYADSFARPDKETYDILVKEYGKSKAKVILSAIQVITLGNIVGIPTSAFIARLKKKPYKNSTLAYELTMQLSILFILPFALLHSLLRFLTFQKNILFSKEKVSKEN